MKAEKSRSAKAILESIGAEKASTQARRGQERPGTNTRLICRSVMRHPNEQVLDQLQYLHQRLGEVLSPMSDESLDWMLGANRDMAYGGFQDAEGRSGVEKLRRFLEQDPKTIPPQRLIATVETLCTAIGYRQTAFPAGEPPLEPETQDQEAMLIAINQVMQDTKVQYIGKAHSTRAEDNLDADIDHGNSAVYTEAQDLSSASEAEDAEDQRPRYQGGRRAFRAQVNSEQVSWPAAARSVGIEIRGNTSGTAPLTLSVIEGLYRSDPATKQPWIAEDSNVQQLAGALLTTTFNRANFHSIAESAAGVHYYLQARQQNNAANPAVEDYQILQPKQALEYALSILAEASADTKQDPSDRYTLREAIQAVAASSIPKSEPALAAVSKQFKSSRPQESSSADKDEILIPKLS